MYPCLCLTAGFALALILVLPRSMPAAAQNGWQTGIDSNNTTTLLPAEPAPAPSTVQPGAPKPIQLIAYLTGDGQRIDKGLVWRIYTFETPGSSGTLISTSRKANPTFSLNNGRYIVNASFGRANVTREVKVDDDNTNLVRKFVLNAGGLRVQAVLESGAASENAIRYDIFTDRDQLDNRQLVLGSVRPGLIIRLNAGIYHIVSKYGDANAKVTSDITVEPGKLTEATVTHTAAKVRLKLVTRSGGEALPDTQWRIKTSNGDTVKTSVGALPTHILAPGSYTVVGVSDGESFERNFTLENGQMLDLEVIK